MSGENQIDTAELERLTNEEDGWELQTPEKEEQPEPNPEAQTTEPTVNTEPQTVAPEVPVTENKSVEVKVDDVISKVSKETPYKTVEDLINGYKSSQSEVTKFIEKVKPLEQLINDVHNDAGLRQFIDQAVQLYRNPSLAQQYAQPQQQQGVGVNPANYDLYTPEGQMAYQQAVEQQALEKAQKVAFETVNQRMSGWEQQQAIEKAKLEFSRENPEANVDDVLKFVQERNGKWSLSDAYKIKNYDSLKAQAYEQAKKEILSKANEAGKNQTANTTNSTTPAVSPADIVQHVTKYGLAVANKRWGADKVKTAIEQFTRENEF
jgi:hypothetical protein